MLTADQENLLAMIGLLGSGREGLAPEKLACRVFINAADDPSPQLLAIDLAALLDRSLKLTKDTECDLEVAVGTAFRTNASTRVHIALTPDALTITLGREQGAAENGVHGLFRKIAACYAAGNVIARAVGGPKFEHLPEPFEVKFATLGVSAEDLQRPIALDDAVIVGAGGVANGFFWGAAELNLSGELTVCDPKGVSAG